MPAPLLGSLLLTGHGIMFHCTDWITADSDLAGRVARSRSAWGNPKLWWLEVVWQKIRIWTLSFGMTGGFKHCTFNFEQHTVRITCNDVAYCYGKPPSRLTKILAHQFSDQTNFGAPHSISAESVADRSVRGNMWNIIFGWSTSHNESR